MYYVAQTSCLKPWILFLGMLKMLCVIVMAMTMMDTALELNGHTVKRVQHLSEVEVEVMQDHVEYHMGVEDSEVVVATCEVGLPEAHHPVLVVQTTGFWLQV